MAAFCVRHREEYVRICKALTRVMKEQRQAGHSEPQAWHSGRRSSQASLGPIRERADARSSRTGGSSDRASPRPPKEEARDGDEEQDEEQEAWGAGEDWWWRW